MIMFLLGFSLSNENFPFFLLSHIKINVLGFASKKGYDGENKVKFTSQRVNFSSQREFIWGEIFTNRGNWERIWDAVHVYENVNHPVWYHTRNCWKSREMHELVGILSQTWSERLQIIREWKNIFFIIILYGLKEFSRIGIKLRLLLLFLLLLCHH